MRATAQFTLTRPCAKCPFRTDVPGYLRPERATEIAREILSGQTFWCHATVDYTDCDGEDVADTSQSRECAGAMILLERMETPNQAMRWAERLGGYDRSRLDMDAPVHESPDAFIAHHGGSPDVATCDVCGPGCQAPAGYLVGGNVVLGLVGTDLDCMDCGIPVCETCAPSGVCPGCEEAA